MDWKKEICELSDELIALRRDFHAHPELGWQEHRTAGIVENYLKDLGIEVSRCTPTGIIGLLHGDQPGKTVMLRSDLDALPVQEQTGLSFASQTPGIMHACGHDGHIAMLLIVAKLLARHRDQIRGTVKFLFQPNEEDAGAEQMIEEGALENPKPDVAMGLHLWTPLASGKIGIVPGPIMASSYYFKVLIRGKGGHGGMPHQAINPIEAAAQVVQAIGSFRSAELDAQKPSVISVGMLHGGDKEIVIPETAELQGSVRCLHQDDAAVRERFTQMVEDVCRAFRCTSETTFQCGNTLLFNDPHLTDLAISCAEQVVGKDNIQSEGIAVMVGDDFAEFCHRVPGVYYFVGTGNPEKKTDVAHHNPLFAIDEDSLLTGVEMQIRLLLDILQEG